MVRRFAFALAVIGIAACRSAAIQQPVPSSGIANDIAFLTSARLEGRAVGTAGGRAASLFLAQRYIDLGVPGAFPSVCEQLSACGSGYFQVFQVEGVGARNVLAAIRGTDSSHRGRYLVVSAHYDHLGPAQPAASSTGSARRIRPGADDNASGTAALLELGRRLAANPPPAPVILAHFDAEEIGLVGSREFAESPSVPLDSIVLVINLDMIGRLEGGQLTVELTPRARHFRSVVDSLADTSEMSLRYAQVTAGRSDHSSFSERGVPAMALFTGFHGDYHRTSDTADKLDYTGIDRIVDFTEAIVRATSIH